MANVLFALLGSPRRPSAEPNGPPGRYSRTQYNFGPGPEPQSSVFAVSLVGYLRRAGHRLDKIVVFGTAQSAWGALLELIPDLETDPMLWPELGARPDAGAISNAAQNLWADVCSCEGKRSPTEEDLDEQKRHLDRVSSVLGRHLGSDVRCVRIGTLMDGKEQTSFIDEVNRQLDVADGQECAVWVDVTHGLGHQRILLAQTVAVASSLRPIEVRAMYSGVFDLPIAHGVSPVVRLDGYINNAKVERAARQVSATGDPLAFADLLPTTEPLREQLRTLSNAVALNQPAQIRNAARVVSSELAAASGRNPVVARIHDPLKSLLTSLDGPVAAQQFGQARAMLARGNLVRASIAMYEGCVWVGEQAAPNPKGWREWVASVLSDADWRDLKAIRHALAHGSPPKDAALRTVFGGGPPKVGERLEALLESVETALRKEHPAAFR